MKDLSNISTANKQRKSRNNLDMTVATLMDKYGTLCSIYNLGVEWFLFASAVQVLCNNAGITHPDIYYVYVVYTDKGDIFNYRCYS